MLDGLTKQKEDLEEVETEMELVDEDEQVMSVPPPSLLLHRPPKGCMPRNEPSSSLTTSFPTANNPPRLPCRLRFHPLSTFDTRPHRYKIDTTFVHLPASEALEHLQAALEKIRKEVDSLETEKQECEDKMDELKKDLYAKFGSKLDHVPLSLPRIQMFSGSDDGAVELRWKTEPDLDSPAQVRSTSSGETEPSYTFSSP